LINSLTEHLLPYHYAVISREIVISAIDSLKELSEVKSRSHKVFRQYYQALKFYWIKLSYDYIDSHKSARVRNSRSSGQWKLRDKAINWLIEKIISIQAQEI
jgi:hypothetical protein